MKQKLQQAIALICMFVGVQLYAQQSAITGTVKTSDGKVVEFAQVVLKGTSYSASTNASGEYRMDNVEAGTYTIVASYGAGEKTEKTVELKSGETINVDFALDEKVKHLKEFKILGKSKRTEEVAKVPLKNTENSQVYNVVDKETLESQQISNMEDAMKNAAGVGIVFPATGRVGDGGTYYTSRGFTTNASLVNGIAGAVFSNPDASNIERIEVLKGPSATLYGSSLTSFGGAINMITKKPYDSLGGAISVSTGSWGLQRYTVDFNAPLNKSKTALFRINGAHHYQKSFQDYGFTKRIAVSPSFSYEVNKRLSFQVDATFSNIQATLPPWFYADSATTGVTSADKLKMDYYTLYFPGDLFITTKTSNAVASMNYKLSNSWKSQTVFSTSSNISSGAGFYMYLISDTSMTRENQTYEGTTGQYNLQQNFTGDFGIAGLRNRMVVGADYYRNVTSSQYPMSIGLRDTVYNNRPNPNYMDYNKSNYDKAAFFYYGAYTAITKFNRIGVYASDVVNVTDNLLLNVGARFDHYINEGSYEAALDSTYDDYEQSAVSPKFGVVYQILPDKVSLFANYQNSFQNVNGKDFSGKLFEPQGANQWEAGTKLNLLNDRVYGTFSYYDITVTNTLRADPEHINFNKQDGTQRSKGFEADLNLRATKGFSGNIGYGYNDNKYVKAGEDVQGRRPVESGADHIANAWLNYRLENGTLEGLGLGFGGNYSSRKYVNNNSSAGIFFLPEYVVLNAGLSYTRPAYVLSLNVNNLANQKYWIGWNNIVPQSPREILVRATWKF
jgi:iron complex outermembrane recepter protein